MKFNYQARTKEGEIHAGIVEASSKDIALSLLQKHGFYVTYLEEAKVPFYAKRLDIFQRISQRDIVIFSRQLAMMFNAKIPLVEALRILSSQTKNLGLQEKILDISEEIEAGTSFSKALSRYPDIFSVFYISMVKAGETSGKLSESLNYLADHLERNYRLSSKIKGVLVYPIFVVLLVSFVLMLMIHTVIPQFKIVLEESDAEIPVFTQKVLATADFLRDYSGIVVLIMFMVLFLLLRFYKTEKGKELIDRVFLKMPGLGSTMKIMYLSRLAENLSTLISGGLMITQALDLSADVIGNTLYKRAIISARDEVRRGVPVSSVLALYPEIFPPVFVQMTLVGEKTGTLDTSLMKIALFYRTELEEGISRLLSVLEPLLIVGLGLVVAGLMFSILMPMYQMMTM